MSNTNQKPEIISHFTKCSCSGELLEIQYYKDYDDNVEFDLVMWEQGLGKRPFIMEGKIMVLAYIQNWKYVGRLHDNFTNRGARALLDNKT